MANGAEGQDAAEARYVAARLEEDYVGCVKELLSMTVWLPVKGPNKDFIVAHRGDQGLVRAYTSPDRLTAIAADDVDPAAASRREFRELINAWRHPEIGIVINPDSESEFQIPRRLFDRVLQIQRKLPQSGRSDSDTAPRRPLLAPIDAPAEVDGFQFVAMVDTIDKRGMPGLSPERGRVEGEAEKQRIRQYLDGGAVVQYVPGFVTDMFDPSKGEAAPASSRTDGEFVWSDGVRYYLEEYGIAPEPDFYRAIVAAGYMCPELSQAKVEAAGKALQKRQRTAAKLYRKWREEQDSSKP